MKRYADINPACKQERINVNKPEILGEMQNDSMLAKIDE